LSSDVAVDLHVDQPSTSYGELITFDAGVTSVDGSVSGLVSFIDTNSGTTIGQGDIANSAAVLALSTLHAGNYSILAHYEGDSTFNPGDSAASALTIDRAATSAVLQISGSATITLTVSSNAAIPDGGDVTLL